MPMPRSPRAMTASIAPSLISTDPDWASRKKTSPATTPLAFNPSRAMSTVASFVRRSLNPRSLLRTAGPVPGSGSRARLPVRSGRVPSVPSDAAGERLARNPLPRATRRRRGGASLELSPYDNGRNSDRRLSVGDRCALAVFSACSSRVAEIGADHVDLAHELRALAYQRRSSQGLSQFSISDAIALRDFEGEIARHDVDLSAAHLLDEDPVFDGPKDLRRVRCARRDHRVRHPADRQVAEGFAPSVAASRDAELLGVLSVGEVGTQHAALDEDGSVRRCAFIVHRRGAALVGICTVVDHGDELARDLLPDPA